MGIMLYEGALCCPMMWNQEDFRLKYQTSFEFKQKEPSPSKNNWKGKINSIYLWKALVLKLHKWLPLVN